MDGKQLKGINREWIENEGRANGWSTREGKEERIK